MLIEPQIGQRLEMVAHTVGNTGRTAMGITSIIDGKLGTEGHWRHSHMTMGFRVNVKTGEMCLPIAKNSGGETAVVGYHA